MHYLDDLGRAMLATIVGVIFVFVSPFIVAFTALYLVWVLATALTAGVVALVLLMLRSRAGLYALSIAAVAGLVVGTCALTGCAQVSAIETGAATNVATATAQATAAIKGYQAVLGIAEVAETAFPVLMPFVAATTAVLNPMVTKLQSDITNASVDVATVTSETQQLTTQALALEAETAGVIHVVPNTTPTTTTVTPVGISRPQEVFAP